MPIVETQSGRVEGVSKEGIDFYGNIPYAAPPIGGKRWQPPEEPKAWSGTREAAGFGPISWQLTPPENGPLAFDRDATPPAYSEDCLSLNIWTSGGGSSLRPVMVWIHGGGFTSGSGASPIYNGIHLAKRGDVVVVTINYRLGALGFLRLNEVTQGGIPSTGNEGLLDQALALQWVQNNIEQFGGDPFNVTIFGESAGGMSVGAQLALTGSKELFHKAIPQSGAASTATTVEVASEVASRLLHELGINESNAVSELLKVNPEKLIDAGARASGNRMAFQPCIDGEHLTAMPIDCIAEGSADGKAVLVGATRDEWMLFSAMDPSMSNATDEQLQQRLGVRDGKRDLTQLIATYKEYLGNSGEVTPAQVYAAIETDRAFRIPGIRLAETIAERGGSVYQYLFTVESPAMGGFLKSCHAIDIGYVFGTLNENKGTQRFFGNSEGHVQLSEVVMDAWLKFAHEGNPATGPLSDWEQYNTESRCTGNFGIPPVVESAPLELTRRVWDDPKIRETIGSF